VLSEISHTKLLLAEALHGAIAADALRVPWIPVHDARNEDTLLFKWQDWCLSVALDHQPHFCERDKDFSEELSRIFQTQQPRLSLDNRLEQALARPEAALESLKRDAKSGKFLSTV
jgi:succinoglycan biosynthesis protein ExoV